MNTLFVGIDVGSRDNAVYIMLPDGSKHSSLSVQNNLGGAQTLSKRVVSVLREQGINDVLLGLEATSVYGDHLVCFLREDGALAQFNRKIHVLNPKQVKKFKDAYSDLPKNDAVDAFVIADDLRFGRISAAIYMDDLSLSFSISPQKSGKLLFTASASETVTGFWQIPAAIAADIAIL